MKTFFGKRNCIGADSTFVTGRFVLFLLLLLVALDSCNPMDRNEETAEKGGGDCLSYKDTATHQDTYNYRLYHYILYAGNSKDDIICENKYSEILFDSNDSLLMQMDTVLEFISCQELYQIFIRKECVTVCVQDWKEMNKHSEPNIVQGCQRDGFIYLKDNKNGRMVLEYKIVLGKCLFVWVPYTGWASIPCVRKRNFVVSDEIRLREKNTRN